MAVGKQMMVVSTAPYYCTDEDVTSYSQQAGVVCRQVDSGSARCKEVDS